MTEDLSTLNLVELLDLLEPAPEPVPVSLWPQTAGWIWLGLILAALAIWIGRHLVRRYRANAYRRAALAELDSASDQPAALAEIVRRTALAAYPRSEVAGLHGESWLSFLDERYGGTGFRQGAGRILASAAYAPTDPAVGLAPLVATWIRRHRRSPEAGR